MGTVGISALGKIQIGKEAEAGTAVAATTIWRGLGRIKNDGKPVFPKESVGIIGGTDRSYIPKLGASLSLEETEATFEQLPYLLEAGIKLETPAQDGAGTGYVYEYAVSTTAVNTIRTLTVEGGDNIQAEEMEYAFVKSFELSGVAGEAVMMSAELVGRQVTPTTFTGALSIPTVEEILTSKGKVYIDDADGTLADTQITESILSFSFKVNTGLVAKMTADGTLYFTFIKPSGEAMEILLDLTFEHDTQSVAEKAAWQSETAKQIRLIFEGSALGTGATYDYKTLIIDLAGKWDDFPPLEEEEGNNVYTGTFRARYNADAALFCELVVVNELASLP